MYSNPNRADVEASGAYVAGYGPNHSIHIALPNPSGPVKGKLRDAGFEISNQYLFPLGSDNPAPEWRHKGNYPEMDPGFWLFATVTRDVSETD